jgi:chromosome partitioning protein
MPVIVVANPKGGVGKSTLSTNIAGYLARQGHAVMLGDVDRQQSSRRWLALRPPGLPAVQGWDIDRDKIARPPRGISHVVIDSPAGLHGKRLDELLKLADKVLVPLQPSLFDIDATYAFVQELLARPLGKRPQIAVVAMRAKDGTLSLDQLQHFLQTLKVPVLGQLRDTQNYVQLAARGLTLWDVAPSRVERDLDQWKPLLQWLKAA